MNKVRIEPLNKSEKGFLMGGFVSVENAKEEEVSVHNGNCSDTSGWFNDNCGCGSCSVSQKTR